MLENWEKKKKELPNKKVFNPEAHMNNLIKKQELE